MGIGANSFPINLIPFVVPVMLNYTVYCNGDDTPWYGVINNAVNHENKRTNCYRQVVECWHRVRKVPVAIPSQGPSHTKDVVKIVPGSQFPCLALNIKKGNTGAFS